MQVLGQELAQLQQQMAQQDVVQAQLNAALLDQQRRAAASCSPQQWHDAKVLIREQQEQLQQVPQQIDQQRRALEHAAQEQRAQAVAAAEAWRRSAEENARVAEEWREKAVRLERVAEEAKGEGARVSAALVKAMEHVDALTAKEFDAQRASEGDNAGAHSRLPPYVYDDRSSPSGAA